jgi:hypothetical protein
MNTTASPKPIFPWLMLVSRSLLFLLFQALVALILSLAGTSDAWRESARWWLFTVSAANLVGIALLVRLFRDEGKRYLDLLRFSKATLGKDLLWLLGISLIGGPVMVAPMNNLAVLIFGDALTPVNWMFRSLPAWAMAVGLLFPLTIGFVELPTYFGYVMPRLAAQLKNGWVAWLVTAFFLAAQHCFLPFLQDGRFLLWRFGMFLPFALFAGLVLKLRPGLLPYFAILHGLLDLATWATYFMV